MSISEIIGMLRDHATGDGCIPPMGEVRPKMKALAASVAREHGRWPLSRLLHEVEEKLALIDWNSPLCGADLYREHAAELKGKADTLNLAPESKERELVELVVELLTKRGKLAERWESKPERETGAASTSAAPLGSVYCVRSGKGAEGRLEISFAVHNVNTVDTVAPLARRLAGVMVDLRSYRQVELPEVVENPKSITAVWRWAASPEERHAWRKELRAVRS